MPQIKNNDTDNGAKGLFSTIGDAIGVAFQELGETISSAFNEQKFYNSRLKCIEYITNRGNVKTAVVTMHLKKNTFSVNVCFDILLTTTNGEIKQNKSFYDVDITEFSLIPNYIMEHLKKNSIMDLSFDQNDLQALYKESKINIVDNIAYIGIEDICKSKSIDKIRMIDRVFYTRVEYLDVNDEVKGAGHFGKITGLPNDVANAVYPFKTCELKL
jgi:hypothetical protein